MKYKRFFLINLVFWAFSSQSTNITTQQDLNDRFVGSAQNGKLVELQALFASGAKINAQNGLGMTALMFAAQNGKSEIFDFLISNNADVNITNRMLDTALFFAIKKGNFEIAKKLIKQPAINLNYVNTKLPNATYLNEAAYCYVLNRSQQYLEIIELLLEYDADPNTPKDFKNKTFIDWAQENPEIKEIYDGYLAKLKIKNNPRIIAGIVPCMPIVLCNIISSYL